MKFANAMYNAFFNLSFTVVESYYEHLYLLLLISRLVVILNFKAFHGDYTKFYVH